MNGREMLNDLNAKLATIEQKNADLETELAQVKKRSEAVSARIDRMIPPGFVYPNEELQEAYDMEGPKAAVREKA